MNIYAIRDNILDEWSWIEPELSKAKHRSLNPSHTTGHYLVDILNKRAFVAVVKYPDGSLGAVWLIYVNPDTFHIETWAGKGMRDWLPEALEKLMEWAKQAGVKHITSRSRKGVARVMERQAGWEVYDYYMKVEVDYG